MPSGSCHQGTQRPLIITPRCAAARELQSRRAQRRRRRPHCGSHGTVRVSDSRVAMEDSGPHSPHSLRTRGSRPIRACTTEIVTVTVTLCPARPGPYARPAHLFDHRWPGVPGADPGGVDGDADQAKVLTASFTHSAFILILAHAHTGGGDYRPCPSPPGTAVSAALHLFPCPSLRSARRSLVD